jgi:hypothetical protein
MLTSAAGIVLAIVLVQAPSDCADVTACRAAALDAAARKDYEAFHDLAWRTVQKGKPNDPELLYLVARAQSLSGRPGDALTVVRRLAQMKYSMDAATSDDFERVRALPGWPEVEALMTGAPPPPPPPPRTPDPTPPPRKEERKAEAPPAKPDPPASAVRAAEKDDRPPALNAALDPIGLAYDTVSRRFIVGDRRTDKLVVIDPVFKRTSDMVGSAAGFFGVTAFVIDRERGDLWVTNSRAGRTALQKLQLVSGRVLFSATQPEETANAAHFVDVAVSSAGQVLVLDAGSRRLLRLRPGRQSVEPASEIVAASATSVAALDEQTALVAYDLGLLRVDLDQHSITPIAGAPAGLMCIRLHRGAVIGMQKTGDRLAIVKLTMKGTRSVATETLVTDAELPSPTSFTIDGDTLHYVARADGETTIRRLRLR